MNRDTSGRILFFRASLMKRPALGRVTAGLAAMLAASNVLSHAALPVVDNNGGASNVTAYGALLTGNLQSDGGTATKVEIYYGAADGGSIAGAWESRVDYGVTGVGPFRAPVGSLTAGTTYYYRCSASNATGQSWAPTSASFQTPTSAVAATQTRLVDFFPRMTNGENGVFLTARDGSGAYRLLTYFGDYSFKTVGRSWNIPILEVADFAAGKIMAIPSAVNRVGVKDDPAIRIQVGSDYPSVRIWGSAGLNSGSGSARFYIYQGDTNYVTPLWQGTDGGAFDLTVPSAAGDLYLAVDAGANDMNDWPYWLDIRLQGVAPSPPAAGLVSRWTSDGTASDASTNRNDGLPQNGATYGTGKFGQAFAFDGVDSFVQINDAPSLRPRNLTVECWFRANVGTGTLVSKPLGSGLNNSFALWLQDGDLNGSLGNATFAGPLLRRPFSPATGVWYHVAYTFDDDTDTDTLYLNGLPVATGNVYFSIDYDAHPLLIGIENDAGSLVLPWNGLIDEVRIYDRALTPSEIRLSAGGTADPPGNVHYVSATNSAPAFPYTTWETAATAIQDAVDAAVDGDTVLVGDGDYASGGRPAPFYSLTNRVCIIKAIVVRSVNGSGVTTIRGAADPAMTNGPAAARCAYVENGELIGFTLTGGCVMNTEGFDGRGGGVACGENATLRQCLITGNNSATDGGGVTCESTYGAALLEGCQIENNEAQGSGGGVYGSNGRMVNCRMAGNRAYASGGGASVSGMVMSNCIVALNVSVTHGGGVVLSGSTLVDTRIENNQAPLDGGGLYGDGTLERCLVRNNLSHQSGGGWWMGGGLLRNSLVSGNTADGDGGGVRLWDGILESCTVAGNVSASSGGGLYFWSGGAVTNCIIYTNTAIMGGDNWAVNGTSVVVAAYTCTTPPLDAGGVGNLTNDPVFADAAHSDYRLIGVSPCINAGANQPWMAGARDVDGGPRILEGIVDMGAFETNAVSYAGIPTNGLVGWWPAELNPRDMSGQNNHGTEAGGMYYTGGKAGYGFNFNGGIQSVVVPDAPSLNFTSGFTIEAWVNPNTYADEPGSSPGRGIVSKVGGPGGNNGYQFALSGGYLWGNFNSPGQPWNSANQVSAPSPVPLNVWTHVAWTYDQTNMALYINGVQVASNAIGPRTFAVSTSNLRISRDDNGNVPFSGAIDDVRIYNRALSAIEIWDAASGGAPLVDNGSGATNVTATSALLTGNLVSDGGSTTVVGVCYGTVDSGTNAGAWGSSVECGVSGVGPFSTNTYTLTPNTLYYYRSWASNATGVVWAPASTNFATRGLPDVPSNTHYVAVANLAPAFPFTTWDTAANTIQDAVDAAVDGDTVLVSNGVYTLSSPVVVSNGIRLTSANGAAVTILDGGGAVRCLRIGHASAVVEGLTVRNGYLNGDGAGVYLVDGTLRDSAVVGNVANVSLWYKGGGVYMTGGLVQRCLVATNSSRHFAGGIYSVGGRIEDCVIRGNYCYANGGGAAIYAPAVMQNCLIEGNVSGDHAGGVVANSTLRNCLIVRNSGAQKGGGVFSDEGSVENCTIAFNSASALGGGYGSGQANPKSVVNTIVWGNTAPTGADWGVRDGSLPAFTNVCAPAVSNGVNGVTNDPLFVDPANGNWRLLSASPCIDAGTNLPWMSGAVDLDGNPRLQGPAVDIGAYEYAFPASSIASVVPNRGLLSGGGQVVIAGTGLGDGADITNVTLCGVTAAVVSQSSTQVVVTAGAAGVAGKGAVTVYARNRGTTTAADAYSYVIAAPSWVSATDGAYTDRVAVTWGGVPGATGYDVWRGIGTNFGAAARIAAGLAAQPTNLFMDVGVTPLQRYAYWVESVIGTNGQSVGGWDEGFAGGGRSALFYTGQDTGGVQSIYRCWEDGSRETRLFADTASRMLPAVSPDGTELAYVRWFGPTSAVCIAAIDGAGERAIAQSTTAFGISSVNWAPNGNQLVYVERTFNGTPSATAGARDGYLYRIEKDGSGRTLLIANVDYDKHYASYSPDGGTICFARNEYNTVIDGWYAWPQNLFAMDAGGGNERKLTFHGNGENNKVFTCRFAPDGAKIVYQKGYSNGGNSSIWTVNPDGTSNTMIIDTTFSNERPAYSRDGTKIFFNRSLGGRWQLAVCNPDGSNVQILPMSTNLSRYAPVQALVTDISMADGRIRCLLSPTNAPGTRWRVTAGADTNWYASGEVSAPLAPAAGPYTLTFLAVGGWTTPTDIGGIAVSGGGTATVSAVYIPTSMVRIPGGTFQMGIYQGQGGHTVTLSGFALDRRPVTVGDYQAFCADTGNTMPAPPTWGWTNGSLPMVNVTWNEAAAYAAWAGKRLPTEAEYEYAMRDSLTNRLYPWGDTISTANANYGNVVGRPTVAGTYPPTPNYGLSDIAGNVWEWCSDWYADVLTGPVTNPAGPASGVVKTVRGGSWVNSAVKLRCAGRYQMQPFVRYVDLGFRCAMDIRGAAAGGDGIPAWWKTQYFGASGAAFDPNRDSDGDGMADGKEYVAGTDPTNAVSCLGIEAISVGMGGAWVGWKGGTVATQYLEAGDVAAGSWRVIFTNVPPTSATTNYLDADATNRLQFYRIKAGR